MTEQSILQQMVHALRAEFFEYQNLNTLSEKQLDLLADSNPNVEQIARVMDHKIKLVETINNLEANHKEIKSQWETDYTLFSPEEKEEIAQLKESLLRTIEQLQEMENQIEQGIKKCETELNQQLHAIQKGRSANQAYFKYDQGPPRYIDKKK
ncbi:hypothetical protein GF373_08600 [bacterium]|nr:hypothetical protein [bacterium]